MMINRKEEKLMRGVGDKTRQQIVRAARRLFAKQGFAGTSISQIAKAAKVNHSLIFHHFQNKAQLWRTVKTTFDLTVENHRNKNALDVSKGLENFIYQIVNKRFALWLKHPDLVRMISWQYLERDRRELQGGCVHSPTQWLEGIHHFQSLGEIKPGIDPDLISAFIASSVSGVVFSRLAVFENPQKLEEYKRLITKGILAAVAT